MSRRPKGPRLYLRSGRIHPRTGQAVPDIYYIRDGATEFSTGCGPGGLGGAEGAEAQLAAYIASKWKAQDSPGARSGDPADTLISEIIALYLVERAPNVADPVSTAIRLRNIDGWWRDSTLADVKRSTCQDYVKHRCSQPIAQAKSDEARRRLVSPQGARRELEDLSAAIGYWCGEHTLTVRPKVWMPEKKESPRDALTRSDAARLLRASMGWRWNASTATWTRLPRATRAIRMHLRRFVLIGLYTGTRPGVVPKLLWHESPTQAYVDLPAGTIYRRGRDETDQKTKRRPLVRVPDRLAAHMRRWRAADVVEQVRRREAIRARGGDPATITITSVLHHGGRPIAGRIRRGFESLVADAGLDPDITPHWLRHTCATWLMEADVRAWDASAYTGMTVDTLERIYGHHRPNHQDSARKGLSRR